MIIRFIESEDLLNISDLYSSVFSAAPWNEPWNHEKALLRLSHIYQSKSFVGLLVEIEGAIEAITVGNTEPFLDKNIFHLREMCVNPMLQGKGVGQRLIKKLHIELKKLGVSGVYLTTRNDIKAANFYRKNGYNLEESQGVYEILFNS